MEDPALQLTHVSKSFDRFKAVDDISLSIPRGSIYGFLGPNGAGKTTTLRVILDILRPSSGSLSVLGSPAAGPVRNRIGYLPEEKGLYKKMQAWAVIQYFAMLKGMDRRTAGERAHSLLQRYGLSEFADSKVEALSKGMSQKVQVLAAVAHEPELVILDEPFSGLDPVNQSVLEELIHDMAGNGQTVIFSTHVMQHAERLCDRILLINRGRKIFDGSVAEARATIPRRIVLETDGEIGALRQCPGVRQIERLDEVEGEATANTWQVMIRDDANPQAILRACFEEGISLRRFEFTEPSLHDVFVHLVRETGDQRQQQGGA